MRHALLPLALAALASPAAAQTFDLLPVADGGIIDPFDADAFIEADAPTFRARGLLADGPNTGSNTGLINFDTGLLPAGVPIASVELLLHVSDFNDRGDPVAITLLDDGDGGLDLGDFPPADPDDVLASRTVTNLGSRDDIVVGQVNVVPFAASTFTDGTIGPLPAVTQVQILPVFGEALLEFATTDNATLPAPVLRVTLVPEPSAALALAAPAALLLRRRG